MIRVAVVGASGRTGRRVLAAVTEHPELSLVAALSHAQSNSLGADSGTLAGLAPNQIPIKALGEGTLADTDVVIDFSLPEGLEGLLPLLGSCALVTGTTGLTPNLEAALKEQGTRSAVLTAANFSTGVAVLGHLVEQATRALPDYDIEIVEAHHRFKRDAPSGTALALGHAAAKGREHALDSISVHGRHGDSPRAPGSIGFHAIRGGDIVGEHQVWIAGPGERIQLAHVASSRDTFAQGAARAARWLANQSSGLYTMKDALGLTQP